MQIDTLNYGSGSWSVESDHIGDKSGADIVFVFGDSDVLKEHAVIDALKRVYPGAKIVGASSSGNILGREVSHSAVVATAVSFERGHVAVEMVDFNPGDNVEMLSETLISGLPKEGLKHIFIISDGLALNGSELVAGINKMAMGVTVTGGLAGDGARFQETWVVGDGPARQHRIVAVGFYGEGITIGTGCFAGWSEFGTDRIITRSEGNVLYEIDGEPALDLYKRYLGDYADGLPNSGLRFPLSIKENDGDPEVIRTLLGIDEAAKTITFAGNLPEGFKARLMKPDIDVLIDGAAEAAREIEALNDRPALGLAVSCVGRKIVMDQLIDEELEAVGDVLGDHVQLTGFYSYGEIAPFTKDKLHCELHNQTMTLTVIYEG